MSAPPAIELRHLRRSYGPVHAVHDLSLCIQPGEFFGLLGPSGCGKTTLLRLIAGLDSPDAGDLLLDGTSVLQTPAHRRPIHTVFQSYALFPHLSVRDNVAFGLRMQRRPAAEIRERVTAALRLVRAAELAERRPAALSGGQRQRVALARALVNQPRVVLLDEPLSALDRQLRRDLQTELRELQQRTRTTFVLVTHDQEEALALCDRIAVLRAGGLEQLGSGPELYDRPRNRFVAGFLGTCNLLPARSSGDTVDFGFVGWTPPGGAPPPAATYALRPERLRLQTDAPEPAAAPEPGVVTFPAQVVSQLYAGAETEWTLRAGDQLLLARESAAAGSGPRIGSAPAPGGTVIASFRPESLVPLED